MTIRSDAQVLVPAVERRREIARPDISVIICTRNRADILKKVLQHMSDLPSPEALGWELIVVDNGSTDATREVVHSAAGSIRYVFEPIAGHSVALNTGIRHARADLIAFTDDDAYVGEAWLATIAATLRDESADWVFGPVEPLWPGPVPEWYGPETRALVAALDYGEAPFVAKDEYHHFVGVNHAGRRAALERVGSYRDDLGAQGNRVLGIGNDEDLFRRLLAHGAIVRYEPAMRVRHCVTEARCRRSFHRAGIKTSALGFASYLHRERPYGDPPVPRWMMRKPFDLALAWTGALCAGNWSAAFYHEIQLRRFLTVVSYRKKAPAL